MTIPENSQIQELLAALPEMFPGVQPIPLKNIRPNPDNPGVRITDDQIKDLAENMQANGLLNEIRVNPDRDNPLAGGAQPHPDNFRVKADGRPWELGDFNFIVLTGENRYRAALWLKWETINGKILNPTAKQAVILNHLDNDVRERGWWAAYQSIEQLIKADPNMTQREIGTELKMDLKKVNRALSLLPLLNPETRALIVGDANNSNKGNKGISELAAAKLAGLGPGTGLKPGVKGAGGPQAAGSSSDPAQANLGPPLSGTGRLVASAQLLYPYRPIPPETQDLVYRTLVVACDHQMTENQVAKLVEKVKAGAAPEAAVLNPPAVKTATPLESPGGDKTASTHPAGSSSAEKSSGADSHTESPDGDKTASSITGSSSTSNRVGDKPAKVEAASDADKVFWESVVGISFIKQLKKKVQKGEPLTRPEKVFALLYRFYESLLKPAWKLFKKGFLFLWDKWRNLGGKKSRWFFDIVGALLITWAVIKVVHTVLIPVHWIENKIVAVFHHEGITPSAQTAVPPPVPTPPPAVSNLLTKVETAAAHLKPEKKKTEPVVVYQPAVAFIPNPSSPKTLYDPKILELEIASLPKNSIVKDFPLTPDEGMPADVALSRMQDVIDPDKYTMYIGGSKEIISSVNPTNTTLAIYYKSADPLDFWGGKGPMNFLWEDVKYIHANAIYSGALAQSIPASQLVASTQMPALYQCSLVVSGSKYPLTLQCATPEDLEHLVSTMQYFIRHSRLGRDTALGGMPYPTQGVRLNSDCLVEKLWAGSPMANAVSPMETAQPKHVAQPEASQQVGLGLGDMIWSVDANAYYPPDRKKLEAALASLAPGSHAIFVVSPADRDKAQGDVSFGRGRDFNPKRRKAILNL